MEIAQLTEQNPWWLNKEKILQDDKVREALSKEKEIKYSFEEKNTLLIGPRQVGKTTFVKLFIKHLLERGVEPKRVLYFSCELLRDFKEIIDIVRLSDSLISGKKYLFFDEITFVPDWQRAVKYFLDSLLGKNKMIYITGSSSIALKKETFPGREIKIKTMYPLSFKEFCLVFGSNGLKREIKAKETSVEKRINQFVFCYEEIRELFAKYIQCGGFPRSAYEFMEKNEISEETRDIMWKWFVADIAKIERSERIASSVLIGILKNYCSRFSLSSIAKEMEIGSHVTVRDYLEIFENLFIVRNVFPVDLKREAEKFRKMRKVYFIDPFIYHVFKEKLLGLSTKAEEVPKVVEGIVAEHLFRKYGKVFYLTGKKEIDFYTANTAIEVKWQNRVKKKNLAKIDVKNKVLLSKDEFELGDINIIPVSIFLLL
ncbi:MAG: ATP-binding protein [Candidatus Iainarchaeum archaeon]|uniref:ATP-binding protein n=1 Tax=Candidatus Iainarchaeum sp. TaxID=3101447 RepID=A0A497JJM0_9ARCH|nr:MAG: ATP-binding protein [Candidatus Diapherotrites archaeon]